MKAFVSICLILALSFGTNAVEDTTELFSEAWHYHNLLANMQVQIQEQLHEVRTAVSGVMTQSTNRTLKEIQRNAVHFTGENARVHAIFAPHLPNDCVVDAINALTAMTHLAGTDSAVCLRRFYTPLQNILGEANDILALFDIMSGDAQQGVVRAFIGANAFKEPQAIITRIINLFNTSSGSWEDRRPEIEGFITDLKGSVSDLNDKFETCQTNLQNAYQPSNNFIENRLDGCLEFANTVNNVRRGNAAKVYFVLEDILPDRSQWIEE